MLEKLGERFLPIVLAVVAGLVLAVGIRGFRAEQPSGFRLNPFSTTPLVTEAEPPATEEIRRADGTTLALQPGTIAFAVSRALHNDSALQQRFNLDGILPDIDGRQPVADLAAVLNAWPETAIELRGNKADAEQMLGWLREAGVDPDRMTINALSPAGKRPDDKAELLQPRLGTASSTAALQLVLTAESSADEGEAADR